MTKRKKSILFFSFQHAIPEIKVLMEYTEAATGGVLYKKAVLKNFAKFTGKRLCQSLFLNKVAGLSLWHR